MLGMESAGLSFLDNTYEVAKCYAAVSLAHVRDLYGLLLVVDYRPAAKRLNILAEGIALGKVERKLSMP
jgi:hypothetical protein